jgi:SAM-dependent methyltransferase
MSIEERQQSHWERLASNDPMWVILTEEGRRGRWSEEEFFETGRVEIENAFDHLRSLGLAPGGGLAVDFGCGLGRLSQALAVRFDRVLGIDISSAMVTGAREKNRFGDRVRYEVNASDHLPTIASGSVDFLYSKRVLQHIPHSMTARYISEFGRVLAPGGIAVFQTLIRARSPIVRIRHRIRDAAPQAYRWLRDQISRRARWEMNVFTPADVVRSLASSPAVRLVAQADDHLGEPVFDSRTFFLRADS